MPHGYKIRGIEPTDLRDYAPAVRKLYWSWVVELGIKAKIRDLAAGLDKDGKPLRPISEITRKHRKSAMTPSGKGSPAAPPLSPAYQKSRTQSLLSGRAFTTHAEFFWRYDAWTGESWDVILTYQIDQGRDVFGLSPTGTAWAKRYALQRWEAWKVAGRPAMTLATAPLSSNRANPVEAPKFTPKSFDEFNAHFRGSSPNAVPFRPAPRAIPHPTTGPGNNVLLGNIWGTSRNGASRIIAPPKPSPIAPRVIAPRVAAMSPAPPRPTATPAPAFTPRPQTVVSSVFEIDTNKGAHRSHTQIDYALRAIDSVHTFGHLKPKTIPITKMSGGNDANGAFSYRVNTGEAVQIGIKPEVRGLTLAHEIGHFIEVTILPGNNKGNRRFETDPTMRPFMDAVKASQAFKRLSSLQGKTQANEDGSTWVLDAGHTDYLLQPNEIWARAYAQWIAHRSKAGELPDQLDLERDPKLNPVLHVSQWRDEDFEPIAKAIDAIFRKFGMLK